MKKKKRRIVSWFLTLAMIFSILPTAAYADEFVWPSELTAAETDWEITGTVTPTSTITVGSGQTLTVHGSGTISDFDATIFVVENGGHLVLDKVTITGNTVGEDGAVFVKKGGLLDLGYNEIKERTAPGISGNTIENNEKNLVVAEGARVRLNAEATQTIGVSYEKALETPEAVIEGGRYTILGTESTQTSGESNIVADDSAAQKLAYYNDKLILQNQTPKILYWSITNGFDGRYDINLRDSADSSALLSEISDLTIIHGVRSKSRKTFVGNLPNDQGLEQFDLIFIEPAQSGFDFYTKEEQKELLSYLDSGGRIFINVETPSFGLNPGATALAKALGAPFELVNSALLDPTVCMKDTQVARDLTEGLPDNWIIADSSSVTYDDETTKVIFMTTRNNVKYATCVDMQAGSTTDGIPWGNITVLPDGNFWGGMLNGTDTTKNLTYPKRFAKNLLNTTVKNRIIAASGLNPNAEDTKEASISDTEYRTPMAALSKVVQKQTTTILLKTNETVTKVENELLFKDSTLAYEEDGENAGNSIKATQNKTYIDMTTKGDVNLCSGEAEVTDTKGGVFVGGTLNDDGDEIEGGYEIKSDKPYTLKAADSNSPFTAAKGGTASVTASEAGQVITVTLDGLTYTYTATADNKTFYLGEYNVTLDDTDRNIMTAALDPIGPKKNITLTGKDSRYPYYLQENYEVTLTPDTDYSIDSTQVGVQMWNATTKAYDQLVKDTDFTITDVTGSAAKKVTVTKPVTGDLVYQVGDLVKQESGTGGTSTETHDPVAERDVASISISGLNSVGKFTATYTDKSLTDHTDEVHTTDDTLEVATNKPVTLKFEPNDFANENTDESPIPSKETFSILKSLKKGTDALEMSGNDADLTFDWNTMSYTYSFTPTTTDAVAFTASFEKSHIVHLHIGSNTTMDGTALANYVHTSDTSSTDYRVVVPDGTSIANLKFRPEEGIFTNPVFVVKWLQNDGETKISDVTVTDDNGEKKLTTPAATQPAYLDASFVEGVKVQTNIMKGDLVTNHDSHVTWTALATPTTGYEKTYETYVAPNTDVAMKITPTTGYALKTIKANSGDVTTTTNTDGSYTFTQKVANNAVTINATLVKLHTVSFKAAATDSTAFGTVLVLDGDKVTATDFSNMQNNALVTAKEGTFFVWKNDAGKVYNTTTAVTSDVTLTAQYREKTATDSNGAQIGANDFKLHVDKLHGTALTKVDAIARASAEAFDSIGTQANDADITITGLDSVTKAGSYTLKFQYASASVDINVEVTDGHPEVIGKTASTITFNGQTGVVYTIFDEHGQPVQGATVTEKSAGSGRYVVEGLAKGTKYTISSELYGETEATTSYVDAKEIAEAFKEGTETTKHNPTKGISEKAENDSVKVGVDDNGNYKVTVKENINKSVEIPDIWENVTVDLKGKTIKGTDASESETAKPGIVFTHDTNENIITKPGSNLTITDSSAGGTGTIKGGSGSKEKPNGADGIQGTTEATDIAITVVKPVKVIGGDGVTGENGNGGDGGDGISGSVTPTINGGTVTGGNGADGADKENTAGTGGNGGSGIDTPNKDVAVNGGTIKGGDGGNGGSSTTKGNGGNAGNGGGGINGGNGTITVDASSQVNGGNGGNGGSATDGSGGSGGAGGNGTTTTAPGKTESAGKIGGGDAGDGGNGGGASGSGGSGGAGGNGTNGSTENTGDIKGGSGGNGGGGTGTGNGGAGGAGGNGTTGPVSKNEAPGKIDGGGAGNGGNADKGNGGAGGKGGDSGTDQGNGSGGAGGKGGDANDGDGGNGGAGGSKTTAVDGEGTQGTPGENGTMNYGTLEAGIRDVTVKEAKAGLLYKIYDPDEQEVGSATGEAGKDLTFSGLLPNTKYTVKVIDRGTERYVGTITTRRRPSSDGGDGASATYTITAKAGKGGTINPSGDQTVYTSSKVTYKIKANDGYTIADVTIDGKSIGAVSSYVFEEITASHKIKATFKKEDEELEEETVVADPEETGVADVLETGDHKGYLSGYEDGSFAPNRNMTRAEAAQMFYNLLKNQDVAVTVSFDDISGNAWYAKAVNTLASMDIIKGVGENKYDPERAVTRAEFAAIATRFAKASNSGEVKFSDVYGNEWYYNAVLTAVNYGWLSGYGDGTFKPNNTITRAEVTTIVNKMLGRSVDEVFVSEHKDTLKPFRDVTDTFWAYAQIVEAANAHSYTMENGVETWIDLK